MKRNLIKLLELKIQSILFWSFVFCGFIFIRYFALNEEEGVKIQPDFDIPITNWLQFGVILGLIIGPFYALGEFVFEKYISQKLYLGLSILLKTTIYLVLMIVSLSFVTFLIEENIDIDLPNERGWWMTSSLFWMATVYFFICSLVFSLIRIAIERFGRGMFFNMLIGKYRKPKEEKRIFMFLDLKSSTMMAEKLGHYKYSQLIQDCFLDLNTIINKYDAEIYQYVGDEAVLSWEYKNGVKDNRCVNIYFDFIKRLNKRAEYYNSKYGLIPQFKAGMHGGTLMAAEVGTIKKEMAYHGDVINTTARIQGECNKYDQQFLISEDLLNNLKLERYFKSFEIGNVVLKGKQEEVNIYAINPL